MAREILFMIGEHKGRTKKIENFENEEEDAISSLQYSLNYISSTFAKATLLLDLKQYDITTTEPSTSPLPQISFDVIFLDKGPEEQRKKCIIHCPH
ncbi:3209_t:CDS:2 [Entrophospora sp. SA101]|nr:3209_t:CDS:2 [Entrophospora sp. SA101]